MSFSWKKNLNPLLTVLAVVIAIGSGIYIRSSTSRWSDRQLSYLGFPGELFLRALKCLIIPLIVSSLISALGTLDSRFAGRVGSRAILYYLLTTILSIGLGILLVLTIEPGKGGKLAANTTTRESSVKKESLSSTDTIMDLVRNLIPANLVEACFAQHKTILTPDPADAKNTIVSSETVEGTNILGLVVFSILLGIVCSRMRDAGRPIIDFFTCLSEASMRITKIVINFTPIGVLFLVLPRIVEVDDVNQMLESVGMYTVTVLAGLFVHGFVVLPIVYAIITKRNPYALVVNMSPALLTAFGTSSSSATIPVTINCLEENMGLEPRIARFLVPIGATVNMDGTALYEAVAAIFIAQSRGLPLTPIRVIIISITATFASIGAAGIPQAGLVTMVIVLNAVGLPAEGVYLIFVVDWFLDRFRTIINVLGDSFGAAAISHLCPKSEILEPDQFSYEFPSRSNSTKKREPTPEAASSMVDLGSVFDKSTTSNGTTGTIRVLDKSPKLSPRAVHETEH